MRPLTLWSGPDDQAEPFGTAALWDYFLLARPQVGGRLYVLVARSQNYAWVDALAVGPSGPPPPGWPPADLPPPPDDLTLGWITASVDARLWSDAQGGLPLGSVPAWTSLKQMAPQSGARLLVQDAYSGAQAWLDAANAGPIEPRAQIDAPARWWGITWVDGANVRPEPTTRTPALGEIPSRLPIVVSVGRR